jgi:hypothetical protein
LIQIWISFSNPSVCVLVSCTSVFFILFSIFGSLVWLLISLCGKVVCIWEISISYSNIDTTYFRCVCVISHLTQFYILCSKIKVDHSEMQVSSLTDGFGLEKEMMVRVQENSFTQTFKFNCKRIFKFDFS